MEKALIQRAKNIRDNLGDHGDPYEESLLAGEVTLELKIMVKEIFDHLRSSLDYCTRKIVISYGVDISQYNVYFPIVSKSFKQKDFRSRLGKLLPGLINNRPDLIAFFESFQPFSSNENNWISDFATLSNQNKHEQLNIINTKAIRVIYSKHEYGVTLMNYLNSQEITWNKTALMISKNYPNDGVGECDHYYIIFNAINIELLSFLDRCISGVEEIVKKLESIHNL